MIDEAARREVEARAAELDQSVEAVQDLRELGQVLEGGLVDRREAMQKVSQLVDKLHQKQRQSLARPSLSGWLAPGHFRSGESGRAGRPCSGSWKN